MNTITIRASVLALTLLSTAAFAGAQRPYAPSRTWQVRGVIDRTERESNALRASFERDFRRYDLDRLPRFEAAKKQIQQMDVAFENLRRVADDRKPRAGLREMEAVVRQAQDVDRLFVRNPGIRETVRFQWRDLRGDLQELARIYGIRGLAVLRSETKRPGRRG